MTRSSSFRFPFFIGSVLAFVFILLAIVTWKNAPAGTVWLGDGIQNSSDLAVYFSYLRQGESGHILLRDLFAVEPHALRVDPFWSLLGLFARVGISSIVLHEAARAIGIMVLVFSIWSIARGMWPERDARCATLLTLGGIGTGWLYTVWLGITHRWTPTTYAAPDIVTEFAVGPTLFGGAHGIFALSLLVLSTHALWEGITTMKNRRVIAGSLYATLLLSFHPYSAAVIGILSGMAFLVRWKRHGFPSGKQFLLLCGVSLLLAVPVAYYAWLLTDPIFGQHHLTDNRLPLQQLRVWLLTLLPFGGAAFWMWKQKIFPRKLDWASAWLISSILLLAFLDVPWKRKMTEGLLIAIIFFSMPAWFAVRAWVNEQPTRVLRLLMSGLLVFFAWFGPISLWLSQLFLIQTPSFQSYFYQSTSTVQATTWIREQTPPDAVLLSDDRWLNVWLPAFTGRRVAIGHDHETPLFEKKNALFHRWIATTSAEEKNALPHALHATHLMFPDCSTSSVQLLDPLRWEKIYQREQTCVFTITAFTTAHALSN